MKNKNYWEYRTMDMHDKLSGGLDVVKLENELNKLGKEGWHLVTAFTNELGKNALSLGGIGGNSTVDINIFIFERYVDVEAELKMNEEEQIKKNEEYREIENERKQRVEKENIKSIDDLLSLEDIAKEANTIKRLYGQARYEHFIKRTAREYGLNVEE